MKHEGLVSLFHHHPALAPELLQGPLGLTLPAWSEAKVEPAEFTQVLPTEYRADIVEVLLKFYVDLALSALSGAVRTALEAKMRSGNYQYQSELVRELVGQGLQQGLQQGLEKGREEGHLKGRLEGERRAVIQVLEARGLKVDDTARRRLEACTQLEQLEQWLRAAVTVQSVHTLFEPPPSSKPASRKARAQGSGLKARGPRSQR